jgi:hypothetical protein
MRMCLSRSRASEAKKRRQEKRGRETGIDLIYDLSLGVKE